MWSCSGAGKVGVPTVHSAPKRAANGNQQDYSIGEDLRVLMNGAVVSVKCACMSSCVNDASDFTMK